MLQDKLECPRCGRIDFVQKVSSIVSAGTSSNTYRGHVDGLGFTPNGPVGMNEYITVNSSSQTALSSSLSPPSQPTYLNIFNYFSTDRGCFLTAFFFAMGIVGIIMTPGLFSNSHDVFYYIYLLVTLGFYVYPIQYIFRVRSKLQLRKAWAEEQAPRWQRAITLWQYLYYCHRCDGVYLPVEDEEESFFVPTAQMMEYLYS